MVSDDSPMSHFFRNVGKGKVCKIYLQRGLNILGSAPDMETVLSLILPVGKSLF